MEDKYLKKDLLLILTLFIIFSVIFAIIFIMDQQTGNLDVISRQLFEAITG